MFAHISLEIMLHKLDTHNTLVYTAYLCQRSGFSITNKSTVGITEYLVCIKRFVIRFETRICDTRSHVLSICRSYVNIVSMWTFVSCIGEHERELVSGSYYLGGGRSPSGRRRGIKSEREMMYPPIASDDTPPITLLIVQEFSHVRSHLAFIWPQPYSTVLICNPIGWDFIAHWIGNVQNKRY